ncbi:hypothetical protein D9M70_572960 [compost metagenome]
MAGLVRASLAQPQMTQQRKPNPVVDVAVRKRRTFPRTEDELTTPCLLLLIEQGLVHRARHFDFALRAVILRVVEPATDPSFADKDLPPLKVDEFPLQAVDFSRAHPGEETHRVIVAEVLAHGTENLQHFIQSERLHIGLGNLQRFDVEVR